MVGAVVATRKQRENIFLRVLKHGRRKAVRRIDVATVFAGCERRASTPSQARHFLDTVRGLFRWGRRRGL